MTRRQLEVLKLLAEGKSNVQIAVALGIDVNTVRNHQTAIYRALGLKQQGIGTKRVNAAFWYERHREQIEQVLS